MTITLKTQGSVVAPAHFGATAALTVTAIKILWEGRERNRMKKNNSGVEEWTGI